MIYKNCIFRILLAFSVSVLFACNNPLPPKNIVQYEGVYVCISLAEYANQYCNRVIAGEAIPEDMDTLFGMSWLEGYVVDDANRDIILVGKVKKSYPPYHAEDLFVNLQNVLDSTPSPYCSLDPNPKNILALNKILNSDSHDFDKIIIACREAIGKQEVVTGGVPRNSRHAKIMIFADYDMKRISQGLKREADIRSIIDITSENLNKEVAAKSSMSRFWLHIKENKNNVIYPNYNEAEGIVFINECPVVVLTEKQYTDKEGHLMDNTSADDAEAIAFAEEMSNKYSSLALQNDLFAELENMFRMQACLKAMKFKNVILNSAIDISRIKQLRLQVQKDAELPDSLPGLINYRKDEQTTPTQNGSRIDKRVYIVAGGVSQEMEMGEDNLSSQTTLTSAAKSVVDARPGKNAVFWKVRLDN